MTIKLYNTAERRKVPFEPIDPENVRMYVCGPTVYDRAHLGNARPVIVFDTLFRLLRHVYGADHVTYVRNFTDVDDKINATALARKEAGADGSLEDLVRERSDETIGWYLKDMGALGALEPAIKGKHVLRAMPRATEFIKPMVAMIDALIEKGHAYVKEGHVLFRVRSYENYGALSGRSVDDMIAGARVEVAPFKEDPLDFVLWKPSTDDLPGWDSPWGRGRPGWHIECSAMAAELLGESFDIHGGGNDLQFPHHENEIAQSACMGHGFANVWMHNEMLQVEGKKMSKSLGNFFTVRDLLEQGVPGEVIRFVMLSTHYRKPMDWTEKKRVEAEKTLHYWRSLTVGVPEGGKPDKEVLAALSEDLNTHGALMRLHAMAKEIDQMQRHENLDLEERFLASAQISGLLLDDWRGGYPAVSDVERNYIESASDRALVQDVLAKRQTAREEKDFAMSDMLRDALKAADVDVKDAKEGVTFKLGPNFDPSKLEGLL